MEGNVGLRKNAAERFKRGRKRGKGGGRGREEGLRNSQVEGRKDKE